MKDLASPKWMYLKAAMLLAIGGACAVMLWMETPTARTAILLLLAIWAFCRAYYFAFYVIEKYVDPAYKFSGLWSFFIYLVRHKRR